MPHSPAVVVLTRVYVASPRHTLSAACGSFDCTEGYLHLVLLRAHCSSSCELASGEPGLLVPPARKKTKAVHTDVSML